MKFTILSAAGILAAISQASAVTIVTPWASSPDWVSGGHGNITWTTTAADAGLKCDIYMLNGNVQNSNIVAQVTDPATPVDCSAGKFDIYPLGDFATGQYSIRIGQAATSTWVYSALFNFKGNGTSSPISVVASPSAVANGTAAAVPAVSGVAASASGKAPTATAAVSGGAKNSTSSSAAASASASTVSGAESSMNMNSAAIALGAIAAIALAL
ncbi:uncharacterized protein EV154DRAFT_490984 [Mucor mucedo]|uniref:uncharacterized protein n=1 Tax=Mucor mucedo TaxID=29922 RepID=UPI002220CE95|nr:uncharacterized protein EV154DRAFT_490984 [Mucor mucedo]KAI7896844.1 hypothetical protein EV154DRAFT_490984 [Mucor mucedo]